MEIKKVFYTFNIFGKKNSLQVFFCATNYSIRSVGIFFCVFEKHLHVYNEWIASSGAKNRKLRFVVYDHSRVKKIAGSRNSQKRKENNHFNLVLDSIIFFREICLNHIGSRLASSNLCLCLLSQQNLRKQKLNHFMFTFDFS